MSPRYVVRRLVQLVPAAAAIVLLGFFLLHAAPGDPIVALAGEDGDAEYYAFMRERYGLDEPLGRQLLIYAGNVATGDLGDSYVAGRSVAGVIGDRLPATLLLTLTALVLSTLVGVALGVFTGRRANRASDTVANAGILAVYAAPVFWLGQLTLLAFALHLDLFPVQGMVSARNNATGFARTLDIARHLALPAMVLASQQIAVVARLSRTALIDELHENYVRTARAKGLRERRVVWVHSLRRALLPTVTVIGGRIGHLFTGTVVVEIVFGWPGIGRLLLTSIQTRDRPVILGIFLLVAFAVIIANLITDLIYALLDPRIRYT